MSAPLPATRVIAGVRVPAVGTWAIDPEHTYVGFRVGRAAVSSIRGRFGDVTGEVEIAHDPSDSTMRATVAIGTVRTGSTARDEVLRSVEHFDVADHPTATFRSTGTRWSGRRVRVTGALTIVGVTNEVDLDVRYRGTVTDPRGHQRSVFSAMGVLDREAWGMTWNVTLEGGTALIGRLIRIEVEVEAVRQVPRAPTG